MSPELILVARGHTYAGWQEIAVQTGMDRLAGSFSLSVPDGAWNQVPLDAGDPCDVMLGDTRIIRGHLDEVTIDLDTERTTVRLNGRDATADLVDCAAIPAQYKNQGLTQIAVSQLAPFGIRFSEQTDVGAPLKHFTVETGETIYEMLERLARIRGVLLLSDGDGLIAAHARTGQIDDALIEGVNIEAASIKTDWRDRFSRYTVLAQADSEDDASFGLTQQAKGVATDPDVTRYRPTIIQAEEAADADGLTLRAGWESQVRGGRAARVDITTTGWFNGSGAPWQFNRLVEVNAPAIGVTTNLLVEAVEFSLSDRGRTTRLTLIDPDAYKRVAFGKPKSGLFA